MICLEPLSISNRQPGERQANKTGRFEVGTP